MVHKLSVIVPMVGEFPQSAFTLNSIYCELWNSGIDFEVIMIDNWCKEVESQGRKQDKGYAYLVDKVPLHPWLKVLKYEKKLSHWQAKNFGVQNSTGDILWFCDAHCIISKDALVKMFNYYVENYAGLNGTLHLPLSYLLDKPGHELIYKLVLNLEKGDVHYSFTRYRAAEEPYKVPCMSTCGMMMSRELYDELGGWPAELGIYGGGENFINFTLAVLGRDKNIMPGLPLFHFADKRGYSWNYDDWVRNRCIATYCFGGEEFAQRFMKNVKGRPVVLEKIYYDVVRKVRPQRELLEKKQVISIEDWTKKWMKYAVLK